VTARRLSLAAVSHLDHGLSPAHLDFLEATFGDRAGFFLETVEMPEHLASLPCGLHGPVMGDPPVTDAVLEVRGSRAWPSAAITTSFLVP